MRASETEETKGYEARNLVLGWLERRAGWAAPEGKLISAVGKVERLW